MPDADRYGRQQSLAQRDAAHRSSLEGEFEVAQHRFEDAARRAVANPDERVYLVAMGARLAERDEIAAAMKRSGRRPIGRPPLKDL